MKRLIAALVVAGGTLLGAGSAAEAYPIGSATVNVSDTTPAPGGSFDVDIDSCEDDTDAVFAFEGASSTVSCSDGEASASFTAPNAAGTYSGTVTLDSGDGTRVLSFSVTVEAAAPGGQLPETGGGSSSGTTITIALVLLVAGAGMFAVANARRRQTASL